MKFWAWAKSNLDGRVLRLDGAISDCETWLGDEITPKQFQEELNSGEGDIEVWINSPGGDVFAAAEIYNMLKEYGNTKGKVTIKIDAMAISAASVVAMAGDEVQISPVGMMMIHNPWTAAIGDVSEFTCAIKTLNEIKESIINAYELKTKLSRTELATMMDAETWLNARKAIELGFADKILFAESKGDYPAQMFSERKIANSLARAFKTINITQEKETGTHSVEACRRRLKLIGGMKHGN